MPKQSDPVARLSKGGEAAVASLGSRLAAVARRHGWSASRLRSTFLSDPTLRLDARGQLFYAERAPLEAEIEAAAADAVAPKAAYPLSETFRLHSRPGASRTIYLDFDGHTLPSSNEWCTRYNSGQSIVAPAWSLDADPSFSDTEKADIQEIWQRVCEDYVVYDVDVTTELASEATLTRSSTADSVYGTRALVSPISSYFGPYGGIAFLGIYAYVTDRYKPALVFPENLGNSPKMIAEAASHEVGHNLELSHDGSATAEYYRGGGSGETGWAPIMGTGYYQNVTQWSKGEYTSANNQEDDLAVIGGYLTRLADDVGDSTATAQALPRAASVAATGAVNTETDVDYYAFNAGAGVSTFVVSPEPIGPNLDIYAEIRNSAGAVVAWANPYDYLSATVSADLPAGRYYLAVRSTGRGLPTAPGGYSRYGTIGRYTLNGAVPYSPPSTTAVYTPSSAADTWTAGPVSVALNATPASASASQAVAATWLRLGSDPWTQATSVVVPAPADGSNDGVHTLAFYSEDVEGDIEAEHQVAIRIDRTAPVTSLGAVQYAENTATVHLNAVDAGCGTAATRWRTPGGPWSVGTVLTVDAENPAPIEVQSVDALGNTEATATLTVPASPKIDFAVRIVNGVEHQRIRGTLTYESRTVARGYVRLDYSDDGTRWNRYGQASITDSAGFFDFGVTASTRRYYRLVYQPGFDASMSAVGREGSTSFLLQPSVKLSLPAAPKSVRGGAAMKVTGSLLPAHSAGSKAVTLYFQRYTAEGWVAGKQVSVRVWNRKGVSRYSASVRLRGAGLWRVRAFHGDWRHAATYSSSRTFRVR